MGSSTLANWIKENIAEDKANGKGHGKPEGPKKEKPEVLTDKEKLHPRKVEAEVLKEVKEGTGGDKNDQIALEYIHWGPAKSKPAIWPGNFRESEVRCSDSRADWWRQQLIEKGRLQIVRQPCCIATIFFDHM